MVSAHLVLEPANLRYNLLSSIDGSNRGRSGVKFVVLLRNLVNNLSDDSRPPFSHSLISVAMLVLLTLGSDGWGTNENLIIRTFSAGI